MKLGKFHKIRSYVLGYVLGVYQTPYPVTQLSNSLKRLCAPLGMGLAVVIGLGLSMGLALCMGLAVGMAQAVCMGQAVAIRLAVAMG